MNKRQLERAIEAVADEWWEYHYECSLMRVYKAVPGLGTIGCDEWWRIYYDPECKVTDEEAFWLIVHELGHLNGEDAARARELEAGESFALAMMGKNPTKEAGPISPLVWNMCCDARINAPIRDLGGKLPQAMTDEQKKLLVELKKKKIAVPADGGVFPETLNPAWAGREIMPPEVYYVELRDEARARGDSVPGEGGIGIPDNQSGGGGGGGQPGDQQGSGQGSGDADGNGQSNGQGTNPGGSCGSVATGKREPWEDAPDEDCPSETERQAAIEETEKRVAERITDPQKARARDRAKGTGIGSQHNFPMLIDPDKAAAKVNHAEWIAKMQQIIYEHLEHARRTWEQPHRRVDGLPGRKRHPKQAVIVCDISGSINELSVQRTFEVLDRLWGRGFDLQVIACDTQATHVTDRKAVYSGGGTALGAGLTMAAQKFPHAGVVIVVTDGHTHWPDVKPNKGTVAVMSWGAKGPAWAKNVAMPGLTEHELVRPVWPE